MFNQQSLIFLLILCDGLAAPPVLPGWFFLWHPLGSLVWQHSADEVMGLNSGGTVGLSLHVLFHPQRGQTGLLISWHLYSKRASASYASIDPLTLFLFSNLIMSHWPEQVTQLIPKCKHARQNSLGP